MDKEPGSRNGRIGLVGIVTILGIPGLLLVLMILYENHECFMIAFLLNQLPGLHNLLLWFTHYSEVALCQEAGSSQLVCSPVFLKRC